MKMKRAVQAFGPGLEGGGFVVDGGCGGDGVAGEGGELH